MTLAAIAGTAVGVGVAELAAGAAVAATGAGAAGLTAIGAGAAAALTASTVTASSLLSAASLAWSIGSTLMSMFGQGAPASGPRLTNMHVQSAAYGTPRKRFWGVDRMAGELVWVGSDGKGGRGWREHKHELGGKGKGGGSFFYTYEGDFAISINAASKCKGVIRIWADNKLIYDHSNDASLETIIGSGLQLEKGQKGRVIFYDGAEDQKPPALMEALTGIGKCSAYRNQFIALFNKFDLTEYGHIPSFSFECYTDGAEDFRQLLVYDVNTAVPARTDFPAKQVSWSYVDPSGEIFALAAVQSHFWDTTFGGEYTLGFIRMLADGSIIPEERPLLPFMVPPANPGGNFFPGLSDEPLAICGGNGGLWCFRPGKVPVLIPQVFGAPDFFAKKGDEIYIFKTGAWGQLFQKRSFPNGALLAQADYATFYSPIGATIMDQICVGDDYLWGFIGVRLDAFLNVIATPKLFKIDPDSLEVLDTIDLGSTCRARAFYVVSDDDIKLIGQPGNDFLESTGLFYEYVDGQLKFLGQATAPGGNGHIGTLFVRNGVWYTGPFGEWGYYDTNIRTWTPGAAGNCVPLWKIQRDINIACNMDEEDFDVSELTDCVPGYTLDQQMTGRDATLPLQRYAHYDARERDLKVDFVKRGHDSVATINPSDMAVRNSLDESLPPVRAITRGQESELPFQLHIRYRDKNADYETGHIFVPRMTTESTLIVTIDLPVVMDETKARQVGDVLLATYWLERDPMTITFSRKHMLLDVCDTIDIPIQVAA